MEFRVTINEQFGMLLNSFGFLLTEDGKNVVTYKSNLITIRFIYSSYEYECIYFIRLNESEIEYENFFLEDYLNIKKPLFSNNTQTETKIQEWAAFTFTYLSQFKDQILTGDRSFYLGLNEFYENENEQYNKNLKS